ncbi:hypothetical protein PSN45_005178 [Yamadazyma tenuis]|uniref:Integral membrane protein n=1 Tax=Candida tenuis (strain ATCC 10573 / BCRC 21748 / CBS 615 / JCM 9827 / NBRC 10315 / NRRL Y-1498 / VKM Y-70) TaxID=590646 RepID=G3B0X4_CANTC|nr:uncharacterized protein CANTEDRAFT_113594 [Yamadazyma tenuis ATCC 10573]EGV64831.1 hypothetical protein CANTEDRAFT_113594 [Yamadazyma tenuis ATCC 10573]WEJ97622.1 hypothetical protein PSN45_005178 [Yamadazyma tenuis]
MFKFFRFLLIVLSLAAAVLSVFALTGSYANKSYLTKTYLFNIHLDNLDLSKLLDSSNFSKRDFASQIIDVTGDSTTTATGASATATSTSATSIDEILALSYSDLGLSNVYQVSYWGYCRGTTTSQDSSSNSTFDNSNVNITWCSKPKPGYKFDPLVVFKAELNNTLQDSDTISTTLSEEITYLVDNLSYDNFNLPGDMNSKVKTFGNLMLASFGLTLAGAVLAVISVAVQLLGCFMSPDSCCLSFLNFLYECVIFIILLVGAALATSTVAYTRSQVNDDVSSYGIKAFMSINFYAFVFSGAIAAWICCVFNLLGHCCGLFATGRRRFRTMVHHEPEMAYTHGGHSSDEASYKSHGHDHEHGHGHH